MLTATVAGHDAAFLSLLFQRPRYSIFTVVVPCVCCVCVTRPRKGSAEFAIAPRITDPKE